MELEKALLDMQDLVASADEGGQKKLQQMEKLGRIRSSI
jgi:hypothetical protein